MAQFGVSFNPGAEDPGASGDPAGQGADRLQQAVRLLNLRLPRVNVGGIAPNALMQSRGGQPGMDSALSLQALQRLMQMMAGLGGSPQGAPQGPMGGGMGAPRINPQDVPPPYLGGPITPPGPPNLPPVSPPGPGNLPPRGPVSPPGPPNLPPGGMGPISPPGPPNLPPKKPRGVGPISPPGPKNLPPRGRGPISPPGPKNLPRIRPISL